MEQHTKWTMSPENRTRTCLEETATGEDRSGIVVSIEKLCFGFLCFVSSQGTQADNSQLCMEIYRNFNSYSERGVPVVQSI